VGIFLQAESFGVECLPNRHIWSAFGMLDTRGQSVMIPLRWRLRTWPDVLDEWHRLANAKKNNPTL